MTKKQEKQYFLLCLNIGQKRLFISHIIVMMPSFSHETNQQKILDFSIFKDIFAVFNRIVYDFLMFFISFQNVPKQEYFRFNQSDRFR